MKMYFSTHRGNRRSANQDVLLAGSRLAAETNMDGVEALSLDEPRILCAVIDGMGGYAGGEMAARIVGECLLEERQAMLDAPPADMEEIILRALGAAAQRMDDLAWEDRSLGSMGATLAGMVLDGERALVFNSGDCRVYRLRNGVPEQLSRDHSEVQDLVDAGLLQREEMRFHPRKNIVTSAVQAGIGPDVAPFFFNVFPVAEEDVFFLCSDGVWEALSEKEIGECLAGTDGSSACEELRRRLLATECRDNVSFILAMP
jgi:serine/threonine protein phosphatase PrpC